MKIGALTIGQSPRVDVSPEFEAALGLKADILQAGALDGLSLDEVKKLAPGDSDYILVTRMRDGTEVTIAEHHIIGRMKEQIRNLERQGVETIVIFCTGEFPELESKCPILKPDVLLRHLVPGILNKGRLGVMLPSISQTKNMASKWVKTGLEIVMDAASPYSGKDGDFIAAAARLAEKDVDLIVLDCIGFNVHMKELIMKESGKPVILPRTLLGRICAELLGGK